jgi:hypothetical protein
MKKRQRKKIVKIDVDSWDSCFDKIIKFMVSINPDYVNFYKEERAELLTSWNRYESITGIHDGCSFQFYLMKYKPMDAKVSIPRHVNQATGIESKIVEIANEYGVGVTYE